MGLHSHSQLLSADPFTNWLNHPVNCEIISKTYCSKCLSQSFATQINERVFFILNSFVQGLFLVKVNNALGNLQLWCKNNTYCLSGTCHNIQSEIWNLLDSNTLAEGKFIWASGLQRSLGVISDPRKDTFGISTTREVDYAMKCRFWYNSVPINVTSIGTIGGAKDLKGYTIFVMPKVAFLPRLKLIKHESISFLKR